MRNTMPLYSRGQAIVAVVFFMGIAMVLIPTAVSAVLTSADQSSLQMMATDALIVAESGAENALLRLLRDPSYTGETLTVGGGTATITVTGTTSKTILSQGRVGGSVRTVQVVTQTVDGILSVASWSEVY